MFSNVITLFSGIIFLFTVLMLLWGILNSLIAINEFTSVARLGFPENPVQINPDGTPQLTENGNTVRIDYQFWTRWAVAGYMLAIASHLPNKWLVRNFGRQSISIDDDTITVKKFPFYTVSVPWDGVIDIGLKQTSNLFSVFARDTSKITIYTMDQAINLEGMTLDNNKELSNQLRKFGDSLEERVIDFGSGEQLAVVWRRLKRSNVGVLGLFLVIFWVIISIFSVAVLIVDPVSDISSANVPKTVFNLWNPNFINVSSINDPPSAIHPFGTDYIGRDIFSRVLFGSFYSILIGVVSTTISVTLGAFIGSAAGYIGGTLDQITQRVTEVIIAMPGLPILLLVSAAFTPLFERINLEGAYYLVVFSIFSFIGWGGTARIIRAEVLSLKQSEFIQAERVLGATHYRIITKHIMPNAFSTVIIFFTLGIAGAIIAVAGLAFLGFGSQSTLVWGSDLNSAIFNDPLRNWWGVTFISLCLFSLVLGFNLFGDALRDALDPKLKE
jgi:ABC-type dipeptide/oligopeptide/nickel transport system permease subunit